MKISQAQLREAAQILYPKEWKDDRATALVKALQILHEASFDFETRPAPAKPKQNEDSARSKEIIALQGYLKANDLHVTSAARAIGVNSVTLYSWFNGSSNPRPENLAKIRSFLTKAKTQ